MPTASAARYAKAFGSALHRRAQHSTGGRLGPGFRQRPARQPGRRARRHRPAAPATDLGRLLPEPAAAFVAAHGGDVRCGCRIDALAPLLDDPNFDHVLAVAPQHAARLLAALPQAASVAAQLTNYAFEPIGTLYADYPPELTLPEPMLGLPGGLGRGPGNGFDRGQLGDAPGRLAFVMSAQGAWDDLADPALAAVLHEELEASLGRRLPRPHWVRSSGAPPSPARQTCRARPRPLP